MYVQWYVIQVMKGREDAMAALIGRVVPKCLLQEVFSPKYETEIKVRGRWIPVQKPLLPGYLIAICDDPKAVEAMLLDMDEFARLLSQGNEFVPLAPDEVEIIGGFTKPGNRVVPMSTGVKDGDRVVITGARWWDTRRWSRRSGAARALRCWRSTYAAARCPRAWA